MTDGTSTRYAFAGSNVFAFVQPEARVGTRYDRALASKEAELREALAKIQTLRRQYNEIMQLDGNVSGALLAADNAAVCCIASLTSRQREVMDMVLAGQPSKIIAWELGISQRTVENHRAAIMQKTASKSIAALARLAFAASPPCGTGT